MRADAVLRADGTRLTTLHGEPPLLLRPTGTAADGATVVHLVGGAAGPLAGDRLSLTVDLAAGANVELHSVAATVALPGRTDDWSTPRSSSSTSPAATRCRARAGRASPRPTCS